MLKGTDDVGLVEKIEENSGTGQGPTVGPPDTSPSSLAERPEEPPPSIAREDPNTSPQSSKNSPEDAKMDALSSAFCFARGSAEVHLDGCVIKINGVFAGRIITKNRSPNHPESARTKPTRAPLKSMKALLGLLKHFVFIEVYEKIRSMVHS